MLWLTEAGMLRRKKSVRLGSFYVFYVGNGGRVERRSIRYCSEVLGSCLGNRCASQDTRSIFPEAQRGVVSAPGVLGEECTGGRFAALRAFWGVFEGR